MRSLPIKVPRTAHRGALSRKWRLPCPTGLIGCPRGEQLMLARNPPASQQCPHRSLLDDNYGLNYNTVQLHTHQTIGASQTGTGVVVSHGHEHCTLIVQLHTSSTQSSPMCTCDMQGSRLKVCLILEQCMAAQLLLPQVNALIREVTTVLQLKGRSLLILYNASLL